MRLNVGVLRGGVSPEYEYSLKSGGAVLANLDLEKYRPVDLLVDRRGVLHADGLPIPSGKLRGVVDVLWNVLHGGPGEDGTAQKIFNDLNIPQIGYGSEDILDKIKTKKRIQDIKGGKIRTPHAIAFRLPDDFVSELDSEKFAEATAVEVFQRISPPWVVKPQKGGLPEDALIAYNFSELILAIKEVARKYIEILIEEYINGREVTLGLLDNFRGQEHYNILPLETRVLQKDEKENLSEMLRELKYKLGLKHYFTADFVLTPRGAYLLEIDSQPHLHEEAKLPKSLAQTGVQMPEFVDHCVQLAMNQSGKKFVVKKL